MGKKYSRYKNFATLIKLEQYFLRYCLYTVFFDKVESRSLHCNCFQNDFFCTFFSYTEKARAWQFRLYKLHHSPAIVIDMIVISVIRTAHAPPANRRACLRERIVTSSPATLRMARVRAPRWKSAWTARPPFTLQRTQKMGQWPSTQRWEHLVTIHAAVRTPRDHPRRVGTQN